MGKLYEAAKKGDTAEVKRLLEEKPWFGSKEDINQVVNGETPLLVAISYGRTEIIKLLLKAGVDVNKAESKTEIKSTPLYAASWYGNPIEVIKLLLTAGAKVNEGPNSLAIASDQGHTEIVKFLLAVKADVNKAIYYGETNETPLALASMRGYSDIVQLLLNAGADVNKANKYGTTPLDMAFKNFGQIVKLLLTAGAKLNKAKNYIYIASEKNYVDVVKYLLEKEEFKTDVNQANNYGETPLFAASVSGHTSIVKLLLDAGADASISVPPLKPGMKRRYKSIYPGKSPLDIAKEKNHVTVVQLLENHLKHYPTGIKTQQSAQNSPQLSTSTSHQQFQPISKPPQYSQVTEKPKWIPQVNQIPKQQSYSYQYQQNHPQYFYPTPNQQQSSQSYQQSYPQQFQQQPYLVTQPYPPYPKLPSFIKKSWQTEGETTANVSSNTYSHYVCVAATSNDIKQVMSYYQHHSVPGMDIKKIQIIHNPTLTQSFSLRLKLLQERNGNPSFTPKWSAQFISLAEKQQRTYTIQQWQQLAAPHTDPDYPAVRLLPVWHGTKSSALSSVFTTGYANLGTTDTGYFGKGIYSAHEAEYAYRVYSNSGVLILNWVATFSAYPVIDGDMQRLINKSNYQNYDTHFAPVVPANPNNPKEVSYVPCKPNQPHVYTEVVVFDSAQCLPRFLVELQPTFPKSPPSLSTSGHHPNAFFNQYKEPQKEQQLDYVTIKVSESELKAIQSWAPFLEKPTPTVKNSIENNNTPSNKTNNKLSITFDCIKDIGEVAKQAHTIHLAGSFNKWLGTQDTGSLQLNQYSEWQIKKHATDKVQSTFYLQSGTTYEYKYVVNSSFWHPANNLRLTTPAQQTNNSNLFFSTT